MPKFVIEREVPGAGNLTDAQWREISQKSVNVLKGMGCEIRSSSRLRRLHQPETQQVFPPGPAAGTEDCQGRHGP
jgi:hypothetical protein